MPGVQCEERHYDMAVFDPRDQELSTGKGIGFFQTAGDFPICVVSSIKNDLQKPVKPWVYFCQINDPQ